MTPRQDKKLQLVFDTVVNPSKKVEVMGKPATANMVRFFVRGAKQTK
jgi:hypothetical protein